jgi:hypothetical protein
VKALELRASLVVVVGGCAMGAGPVAGYGLKRGAFWGAEATAGLSIARAGLGWQSNAQNVHVRLESTLDRAWDGQSDVGVLPSMRVGAGHVVSGEGRGTFVAGPSVGYLFREQRCGPDDASATLIGLVSLDVRYIAGDWQLALAPRVERRTDPASCVR